MKRRAFKRNATLACPAVMLRRFPPRRGAASAEFSTPPIAAAPSLESSFACPPPSARPCTYWMWTNGHVTQKGITLDRETMRPGGIGGGLIYNDAVGIPRGPVDCASERWMEMVVPAAREARLAPPQPCAKLGYYRDAYVPAFPAAPVATALMRDCVARVTLDGAGIDRELLLDGNPLAKVRLARSDDTLVFEFAEPFEARAITAWRQAEEPKSQFDGPQDDPPALRLEASDNGADFRLVGSVALPALRQMDAPGAAAFPAVTARFFRLASRMPRCISAVALHATPRRPEWFLQDAPEPGARVTFSTWRHYRQDEPLLPSGRLGPVRRATAAETTSG